MLNCVNDPDGSGSLGRLLSFANCHEAAFAAVWPRTISHPKQTCQPEKRDSEALYTDETQ